MTAYDEVVITVTEPNQAPQVSAGADQSITLPVTSVSLQGETADDGLPVGSNVTVQWTKVSGAGNVSFGNATQAATTATFSSAGANVLRLTATDGALTAIDDVQINVIDPAVPVPTVAIASPTDGAEIKAPTAVGDNSVIVDAISLSGEISGNLVNNVIMKFKGTPIFCPNKRLADELGYSSTLRCFQMCIFRESSLIWPI